MRILRFSFAILFIALCFFPLAEMYFHFFPTLRLNGQVLPGKPVQLSVATWFDGSFQKFFEAWFNGRMGFREYLIKTDNQINYSLFHEVSSKTNTKIILGKDNYLYEKAYIDNYNALDSVLEIVLEKKVQSLKKLQEALDGRGIAFLFIIAPTKAAIYPEFIADRYLDPNKKKSTNYGMMRPLLKQYGIRFIDAHEYFIKNKLASPYPLFVRGGTHWNYYGACLITAQMVEEINKLMKRPAATLTCEPVIVDNKPYGKDRDLVDLLNTWDDTVTDGPTPHPTINKHGSDALYRPDVLYIGDSFAWQLAEIADGRGIFRNRSMYYYYSRDSIYPGGSFEFIDKKNFDWQKNVFSRDAVIIEASETALPDAGFGFVEDALANL